jgi:DNA-binding response OmpR family regulator
MRILLVEDDVKLGFLIEYKLKHEGHQVDWAKNSEEAESLFAAEAYDLYILDWMIPGKSGLELCKERRKQKDSTAILMLTARDAVEDRVKGLVDGADDYLVKPFAFEELFARMTALDRRKQTSGYEESCTSHSMKLNLQTQEASRDGSMIYLTKREFQLLSFLMRNPDQVLSRERILNYVWGTEADVTLNAVDATVKLLRKKIDDPYTNKVIQSVHGRGYRFSDSGAVSHD